jgi:uncharacterized hydantoinase/oxoprolinase family protein
MPAVAVEALAHRIHDLQVEVIARAIRTVISRLPEAPRKVVLAGSGEFLAERALNCLPELAGVPRLSFAEMHGQEISVAACAYALAVLARERQAG